MFVVVILISLIAFPLRETDIINLHIEQNAGFIVISS